MKSPCGRIALLIGATMLSACVRLDRIPPDDTRPTNQAAAFCANEGGSYNLDNGNCRLKDGTVVDGQAFYRKRHQGGE